ncbi:bile acid 7-alpha dehydratase [Gordonia phthalatica]|uniref:Bile acid 7-alpha dehydratase n=1 Tax=Gordonia phthalatica TaxID=1136941 RepID=A0A0N9N7N0_9ACTN|nr:nuclear transport factor 2 family protein [Gordonia phthalatica]ALG86668.1 bile acid 7-alpha dehydratase [Gordonia phthalatica]
MTVEERLAALEDIEQIKALKHRYWRACDRKDPQGFRDAFIAHGAVIDYGPLGVFDDVEPMAQIFTQIAFHRVDGKHVVFDMHHGMHPDITVTGPGTAIGRWTLRFRQVNTVEQTESVSIGEYNDEYVIEDGEWKTSRCVFTQYWSITRPLDPAATITEGAFADGEA